MRVDFIIRNSKWLVDNHVKAFYSLTRHPEFSEGARLVMNSLGNAFLWKKGTWYFVFRNQNKNDWVGQKTVSKCKEIFFIPQMV